MIVHLMSRCGRRCSDEITYCIDEKRAHAEQQYNDSQHLLSLRERIDSQSGEHLVENMI